MLLFLSGQPCLLCAPCVPCLSCVHRPLSASSGFWSLFSSTPPATNKNIPLSSFNWHWHWHLDGTDDSEVFHNVILMLVYRVKVLLETGESESVDRYNWKRKAKTGFGEFWTILDMATRLRNVATSTANTGTCRLLIGGKWAIFLPVCEQTLRGAVYRAGWGWKTCAGVSATMPCAVTSKVG